MLTEYTRRGMLMGVGQVKTIMASEDNHKEMELNNQRKLCAFTFYVILRFLVDYSLF